ncbi:hypothetical protein JB92DRAFT_3100317, partial [Gautieria morchelliformis]
MAYTQEVSPRGCGRSRGVQTCSAAANVPLIHLKTPARQYDIVCGIEGGGRGGMVSTVTVEELSSEDMDGVANEVGEEEQGSEAEPGALLTTGLSSRCFVAPRDTTKLGPPASGRQGFGRAGTFFANEAVSQHVDFPRQAQTRYSSCFAIVAVRVGCGCQPQRSASAQPRPRQELRPASTIDRLSDREYCIHFVCAHCAMGSKSLNIATSDSAPFQYIEDAKPRGTSSSSKMDKKGCAITHKKPLPDPAVNYSKWQKSIRPRWKERRE